MRGTNKPRATFPARHSRAYAIFSLYHSGNPLRVLTIVSRTSAACTAAVAGRPSRFPFWRAWANPALVRSRRTSLSNSEEIASSPRQSNRQELRH
jgi:hypothetical protein